MKFLVVEPSPLPILISLGPKYSPQEVTQTKNVICEKMLIMRQLALGGCFVIVSVLLYTESKNFLNHRELTSKFLVTAEIKREKISF